MMPCKRRYTRTRQARRSSCVPSCFAGSSALESDDETKPPAPRLDGSRINTRWSRLRRRKHMVPVVAPEELVFIAKTTSNEADIEENKEIQLEETNRVISLTPELTRASKKGFLAKLLKVTNGRTHVKANQYAPHETKSDEGHVSKYREPHKHQISMENNSGSSPDRGWPVADGKSIGKLSWLFRMSIPALILAGIVFFGRAATIVCLSSCFYYLPLLDPTNAAKNGNQERMATKEIVLSSGDYKKKVVMQGLLARHGRRPSGFLA